MRMRGSSAVERLTQFAISAAAIWSACYLISVILHPRDPVNRGDFLIGTLALAFVELHGVNLTAVATIVSCVSIFWIMRAQHKGEKTQLILLSSISFFVLACCVIAVFTGMDRYSRRSIQWARVAGARHNVAFVWAVGGLEKRCETGIPVLKACPSGLVWIAAYSECCPNNDDAAVGQYARHRNADHRATEGRVPWQTALKPTAPRNPILWKEMTWYSEIQALSLLLAPQGRVHALIDAPTSERWKPFQLDAPESLPKSRFWDVAPYATAVESRNLRQ